MNCICGHAEEDHVDGGECQGAVRFHGKDEPCKCVVYERDEDEEDTDEVDA